MQPSCGGSISTPSALCPPRPRHGQFLADTRTDKRAQLIDQLLQRPEYADYWAMRWSDLLRVDRDAITPAGAVAMTPLAAPAIRGKSTLR